MRLKALRTGMESGTLSKQQFIDGMHAQHASLWEYADYLKGTDIARIEISDGQVVMEFRGSGVRLMGDRTDKRIAPVEALNFGHYEADDSNMLFRLLRDDQTIFDIGANIGYYSLHMAKSFPRARVIAIEPIPATHEALLRNVALNQVKNVTPCRFAFSDRTGELTFHYHPEGSGSASAVDLMGTGVAQKIVCPVRTLDSYVQESGARPDFIKCDVEGAELFVLKGGAESIRRFRPIVFAEMLRKWAAKYQYHPNAIIAFMKDLGYRCFVTSAARLAEVTAVSEETRETNFFFLHVDAHAAKINELAGAA